MRLSHTSNSLVVFPFPAAPGVVYGRKEIFHIDLRGLGRILRGRKIRVHTFHSRRTLFCESDYVEWYGRDPRLVVFPFSKQTPFSICRTLSLSVRHTHLDGRTGVRGRRGVRVSSYETRGTFRRNRIPTDTPKRPRR